ncbi:afadin [Polymixia lowei]
MPEEEERQKLATVIQQWNNDRLGLFEISQPNENLEFHGVMRFYFEDQVAGNVATKCLRIYSTSSTHEVIEILSEKFRPDMKMLTTCYSLYEVHTNAERRLDVDEKPLVVQLNWSSDNREGRFVLRTEEAFLSAVINYTNSSTVHFKLSPAYSLYAAGRFTLQGHYSKGPLPSGQRHRVTSITNKMVHMTEKVIQKQQNMAGALAFWMANSSELLNFIKQDKDLSPLTQQAQVDLSHLVHKAYKSLIQCLQNELRKHLPTFLIDPEQHGPLPAGIEMVLNTLMNTMSLLRRCRVNPALTIQLFSQLFHFISSWLFNQLMGQEACALGLRSHYWGAALRQRLTAIEAWAERQGLELAADCHLGHIIQATTLLTMNKYSMQDVKDIQNTCFKLNSLQLQTLLSSYLYASNEPRIPPGLMEAVVAAAESSADNLVRREGRSVHLEESLDLHLPFLLPEGGYSCDTLKGIPQGFREFLEPICCKGLCTLTSQPNCKSTWTVFFNERPSSAGSERLATRREPEIVTITLRKPLNSGMGVSIVAARGAGQGNLGIYVKSIVKGGPADMDGRLTAGDQLLSVDGHSLVGLNQERAARIMMQTGPVVTLEVEKLGACYRGLEALLTETTSVTNTGDDGPRHSKPNGKALVLYDGVNQSSSEQWENHHGTSRRKREQIMQRNRQLYRSNPNVTHSVPADGEEPVDPVVRERRFAAVSTINLCTDTYQREYLTLPAPRSQDKKSSESNQPQQMFKVSLSPLDGQRSAGRTFMRQALSQENLCMDSGGPLLDKQHHVWEQQDQSAKRSMGPYSSYPIRPSISSHNILSEYNPPTKHQQSGRTTLSQHPTPTPSIQPIRIDIPVARAVNTQPKTPLTTFQQNSSLQSVKLNQNLKGNGQTPQGSQKQSSQLQANPIYACPTSATKRLQTDSLSSQQQRPIAGIKQAAKPQVIITPTKHVSFQKLPTQHKPGGHPTGQKDPQYFTMSKELSDANGLSPDPWRRDAREKLEEQQRLQMVDLLEQEVQELQAKASRTPEENDRLRKLSLEWQFQKRLQEFQQNGDEEEEEDEDMMMTIQQLDKRAQLQKKGHAMGQQNTEMNELQEAKTSDQRTSGLVQDFHKMPSKE